MSQVKISQEVSAILNASVWDDASHTVTLSGQLPANEYKKVAKIIETAGGKWNRGRKCHVFTPEAFTKLREGLVGGAMRDDKKHFQEYFTPAALAARVVELAQVGGCNVLEPSAGRGAIATECLAQGAESVFCYEIQPQHAEVLSLDGRYQDVICDDFLKHTPGSYDERFERIVMNPPFAKGAALKHVEHALTKWLAPDGRLVAVIPNIIETRAFEKFVNTNFVKRFASWSYEKIPAGSFRESGADVSTVILTLNTL